MPVKPSNLIYGVNEPPGWATSFLLGFQHIFVMSIAFIFPVVIVEAIGGTAEQAQSLICMAMVATGVGTIVMGLNRGPAGSGYLCPLINGPAFLSASLLGGKMGGLPLIFGMTAVGGIFEGIFSRLLFRLRALFPAEVTGTAVLMVGIEVISVAAPRFLGVDKTHPHPELLSFVVAMVTLLAMVSFNVWGKGRLRLFSVICGLIIGYAVSFFTGLLGPKDIDWFIQTPLFHFPMFGAYGLSFDAALLIPFLVAALSSSLKTMGDLTTCEKVNDAEWKRPDMKMIGRGVLACAVGNLTSGAIGALGQSCSSSNIGLSIATGATSRRIAYFTGGILIFMGFFPKLSGIFVIMPTPVMGASLVFAVSFMILAGLQIITSRMLDARKTFVVGISIIFGLSVDSAPQLYKNIHPSLSPLFHSSLALSVICAILLNLFFRIGIAKKAFLELAPGVDSSEKIFTFMDRQGGSWGALKDVVHRAAQTMNEFLESAAGLRLAEGPLRVAVSFDEFNLDVDIDYRGKGMAFPESQPKPEELLEDETGLTRLSGFLMRKSADRVECSEKNGECHVRFHFNH